MSESTKAGVGAANAGKQEDLFMLQIADPTWLPNSMFGASDAGLGDSSIQGIALVVGIQCNRMVC